MRLKYLGWLFVLWSAVGMSGCDDGDHAAPVRESTAAVDLRVMSFNIEWGGTNISFDKVVEAIRVSGADVVGVQEAEGNLARLADALGWYYDERNYLVSRFAVIDPPGAAGRYAFVELKPGKFVAIANVHLPSDPYGPDAIKAGAGIDEVLEIERQTRLGKIESVLESLQPLVQQRVPLFITGDFNAPAHTDWTAATVGLRRFLRYPVQWPVSVAVAKAGFKDAWRTVHPDPSRNPGLTWWAARPPLEAYAPGENDPQDRIDFIWFAGAATVQSIILVGETGGPEVSVGLTPWPSDHRALLARFSVRPAALPVLATTDKRVYRKGEDIEVFFNVDKTAAVRITNDDLAGAATAIAEREVSGRDRIRFQSASFEPGRYELRMSGASHATPAREFWILGKDERATVDVTKRTFAPGEGIDIRWANAPGYRNDYVAAYDAGTPAGYESGLAWTYVHSRPSGSVRLDDNTAEWGWPLAPGRYVIRLMKDDGYEQLAESAPFTIGKHALDQTDDGRELKTESGDKL